VSSILKPKIIPVQALPISKSGFSLKIYNRAGYTGALCCRPVLQAKLQGLGSSLRQWQGPVHRLSLGWQSKTIDDVEIGRPRAGDRSCLGRVSLDPTTISGNDELGL